MVEDTTNKLGELHWCVKMFAPSPQGGVSVSTLTCEVEEFRLVMFQDKPEVIK
jgi:hypothetical protein